MKRVLAGLIVAGCLVAASASHAAVQMSLAGDTLRASSTSVQDSVKMAPDDCCMFTSAHDLDTTRVINVAGASVVYLYAYPSQVQVQATGLWSPPYIRIKLAQISNDGTTWADINPSANGSVNMACFVDTTNSWTSQTLGTSGTNGFVRRVVINPDNEPMEAPAASYPNVLQQRFQYQYMRFILQQGGAVNGRTLHPRVAVRVMALIVRDELGDQTQALLNRYMP